MVFLKLEAVLFEPTFNISSFHKNATEGQFPQTDL